MDPSNLPELTKFAEMLSSTLSRYYDGTSVEMNWRPAQALNIHFPAADMRLNDDGFITSVDRTGHGLQRALIMTLLQHLAVAGRQDGIPTAPEESPAEPALTPSLILAIEEPELYQHPTKQRHMAAVLEQLGAGTIPGVSNSVQVFFTTHSPHFISVARFEEVRLVRRWRDTEGGERICKISGTGLADIVADLSAAWPSRSLTIEGLKPKLHVIDNAVCDGFFACVVVLVEGVSDKAALEAAAFRRGIDFAAQEIAIIPVHGKSVLDKVAIIFRRLGIPVFAMWDCDKGGKDPGVNINKALLRIFNVPESKLVEYGSQFDRDFLCFEHTLEHNLKLELTEKLWDEVLTALRDEYGVQNRDDAQKVPQIMMELLNRAAAHGYSSATLNAVIDSILALKPLPAATATKAATAEAEAGGAAPAA